MDKSAVLLETRGAVGIVRIDFPPVNALSQTVRAGIKAAFDKIEQDDGIKVVILHAEGRTFVAGADIGELSLPKMEEPDFLEIYSQIEQLDRPVIAALHGTALGGGLVLALACHYRVALPSARLGFPEVNLGMLPGAGGTQRLPRLIGAERALGMILSGKPVSAQAALDMGLVDELVESDLLDSAVAYAEGLLDAGATPRRSSEMAVDPSSVRADLFEQAREALRKRPTGNPAPARIIECVEAAATLPYEQGLALEARLEDECRLSSESKALRHRFFAEIEAAKIPGLPKDTPLRPIERVGVIGAGTMGGGIAMNFANVGIPVVLIEAEQAALDRGLSVVRKNYEVSAARGRISSEQVEQRMALLQGSLDYEALAECDLVIEAVFEDMDLKKRICARLGEVCKPGAIIASNTSTLDVDVLAQATGRPADVVGMHFFSPANVMRLLEIVRGAETAPEVLATVVQLAKTIAKVPVVSGVCFGFIGNRMLESYLRESEFLMMEGATPAQIDAAIQSVGMAMGPCRMLDMAGLDVGANVVIEQAKAGTLPADPSYRAVVQKMKEIGRFGQKTGAGYYKYEGRAPVEDPEVARLCEELAAEYGIERRDKISDQEIIERCFYPLINEGAKILEEGISYRASDIDVVWMNGYGFPDYLGGPMFWADTLGLNHVAERLDHYATVRGNPFGYWTKADLLSQLVQEGRNFGD